MRRENAWNDAGVVRLRPSPCGGTLYCVPVGQMTRVVVKYTEERPERHHESFILLALQTRAASAFSSGVTAAVARTNDDCLCLQLPTSNRNQMRSLRDFEPCDGFSMQVRLHP